MKLYHATLAENKQAILKEGLKAVWGFVYMTPDLAHASRYGEVVFEIDTDDLDPEYLGSYREMICDILNTADYWHYGDDIPPELLKVVGENDNVRV